jgi:hypothetical protein
MSSCLATPPGQRRYHFCRGFTYVQRHEHGWGAARFRWLIALMVALLRSAGARIDGFGTAINQRLGVALDAAFNSRGIGQLEIGP